VSRQGPQREGVAAARDALRRPHDEEDADGTTRGADSEPDAGDPAR
jgi:hypothetical protein